MQFSTHYEQAQIQQLASVYRDVRQLKVGNYEFPIQLQGGNLIIRVQFPKEFPKFPPMIYAASTVKHPLIGAGYRILYTEERHWLPTMSLADIVRNIHSEFSRSPPIVETVEEKKTVDLAQSLRQLPESELARMTDYGNLKRYVDNMPDIRAKTFERDELLLVNLTLSQENIAKYLSSASAQDASELEELNSLRQKVAGQVEKMNEITGRFSVEAIRRLLSSRLKTEQQACKDLQTALAGSSIAADKFWKSYSAHRLQIRLIEAYLQMVA